MRILIISIAFLGTISIFAQGIPIGTWRVHFPYRFGNSAAEMDNKIYVACDNGLYSIDKEDNTLKKFSKVDGFAEYPISRIKYSSVAKALLIGYRSGNIDVLKNNEIINIPDFLRLNFSGSKSINHINMVGDLAYLSTDAGLIILNLTKLEIKEAYTNIGKNGTQVAISSSALLNDSIYVATTEGVKVASNAKNINKLDYLNWNTYNAEDNLATTGIKLISAFKDTLYALEDKQALKYKTNNGWQTSPLPAKLLGTCTSIDVLNNVLGLSFNGYVGYISKANSFDTLKTGFPATEQMVDNLGNIYITNDFFGLSTKKDNNWTHISPSGPQNLNLARAKYYDNRMICLPGLVNANNGGVTAVANGFYIFEENWRNVTPGSGKTPFFRDGYDFHYNEKEDTLYIGTFNGLVALHKNTLEGNLYNAKNSPLTGADSNSFDYNIITAVEAADDGTLYMATEIRPRNTPTLFSKKGSVWKTYNIPFNETRSVYDIVIDNAGNKWMQSIHGSYLGNEAITGGGIVVFNENNSSDKRQKKLTKELGSGNLTSNFVYCMAKAKNGEIWVGTDNGISVFYNPEKVLTSSSGFDASVPVYDSRALFREKTVSCITPDSGDRKWIGTPTDGAWLFSADGSELIYNFTTDNSPLPSNNILGIGINEFTGEVFFCTDKGLTSFRFNAADPEEVKTNVSVFPNPVRKDFQGQIGITGVANNALIKITDVNGKLIHQTRAYGGMASWNGNDLQGKRAETGVYYVFSATADGKEGLVFKVAFLE